MIILGTERNEVIIGFINAAYPSTSITNRKNDIKNILLWREFRKKTLETFGISFSEYTSYNKRIAKAFAEMEARPVSPKVKFLMEKCRKVQSKCTS